MTYFELLFMTQGMQIATQQFQFRGIIPGVGQLKAHSKWITMADLFIYIHYMKLGAQMQNVYIIDQPP